MSGAVRTSVLGLVVCACGAAAAQAEVIVSYESLNPDEGGVAAGQVAAGVVGLQLTRGPGIERATGSSFNTRGWSTEAVLALDDYIEWGWSSADRLIDLEQLDLRYDRSASGPKQVEVHLAINNSPFEAIFCDPEVNEDGQDHLGIDLTDFDAVESAVFRLYGYDASSASGTFDLENFAAAPNQAILVSGNVSAVPEPGSLTLLGSVVAAFCGLSTLRPARRQRRTS